MKRPSIEQLVAQADALGESAQQIAVATVFTVGTPVGPVGEPFPIDSPAARLVRFLKRGAAK